MKTEQKQLKKAATAVYYIHRSSVSGRFVTFAFASKNPKTTVREKRPRTGGTQDTGARKLKK